MQRIMPAKSPAMSHFRKNVLRIIAESDELSIKRVSEIMSDRRKRQKRPSVSRTFLSNMLNGHYDCEVPFAEEVAAVLGVPLPELLSEPESLKQPA